MEACAASWSVASGLDGISFRDSSSDDRWN